MFKEDCFKLHMANINRQLHYQSEGEGFITDAFFVYGDS